MADAKEGFILDAQGTQQAIDPVLREYGKILTYLLETYLGGQVFISAIDFNLWHEGHGPGVLKVDIRPLVEGGPDVILLRSVRGQEAVDMMQLADMPAPKSQN